MLRLMTASCALIFCMSTGLSAQDAKASIRVINSTNDERTVEINNKPFKIKAKSEELFTVSAGEFTYKIIGVDDVPQKRTVLAGQTWGMTIRATVTVVPSDKELPPKIIPKKDDDPSPPKRVFDKTKMAKITVIVPTEEATLKVDHLESFQTGLTRTFMTPDLGFNNGRMWYYYITVTWLVDGVKKSSCRRVQFYCGDDITVDFTKAVVLPAPLYSHPTYRPYYGPIYGGPVYGGCGFR